MFFRLHDRSKKLWQMYQFHERLRLFCELPENHELLKIKFIVFSKS